MRIYFQLNKLITLWIFPRPSGGAVQLVRLRKVSEYLRLYSKTSNKTTRKDPFPATELMMSTEQPLWARGEETELFWTPMRQTWEWVSEVVFHQVHPLDNNLFTLYLALESAPFDFLLCRHSHMMTYLAIVTDQTDRHIDWLKMFIGGIIIN